MALITCKDLILGYEGKPIIGNLNFEVNDGDYLCILGENGAGKTTLMKNILGISKPIGGSIQFGEGMKQNEIGYIPQQSSAQRDFPATVYEVVLSGCLNSHGSIAFYNAKDKKKVESNLERLGILQLKKRSYRELSGGQQQRVLLARALCATKRVLFLDEPMAGLDPKATQDFYELLKSLNNEGITLVMISHDLRGVKENAKQVLHLENGETFYGNLSEYVGGEEHA
ncbi:metal ABC transporter ATP-binding protein [Clostridium aminobutyricum]|uniref:Metal ABC transporter ATP-binding protein n=1 Tax=Clostridium aminobutyricum TaxID=33953 RepID=A0A939IH93_CLOAM|nr:metal ABC transporter ATP-binding protein [Clostridium aminobutyricum]MBN7773412.1 metal ABC transporter ATP-binding protein [Clostridium aminobutyricum]